MRKYAVEGVEFIHRPDIRWDCIERNGNRRCIHRPTEFAYEVCKYKQVLNITLEQYYAIAQFLVLLEEGEEWKSYNLPR